MTGTIRGLGIAAGATSDPQKEPPEITADDVVKIVAQCEQPFLAPDDIANRHGVDESFVAEVLCSDSRIRPRLFPSKGGRRVYTLSSERPSAKEWGNFLLYMLRE